MTARDFRPTRRALLVDVGLVGAAVSVAGCTTSHSQRVSPGPDDTALLAAWHAESRLLASYAVTAPEHAAHLAHLRALEARLAVVPSGSPTPALPGAATAADVEATVAPLQEAARAARDGANAALLASIAASHAVLGQGAR